MFPPIACNTPPIICHHPCIRSQPCGHSNVTQHNCHSDNESCPPCMIFIPKFCHCRAIQIPSPCSRRTPSCGAPCKGSFFGCKHPCNRPCHEGSCDDVEICRASCGKVRDICGHTCRFRCHGTTECPQDKPCGASVRVSCPCGRIKVDKTCGLWVSKPQSLSETLEIQCDDECLRYSRNSQVSEALGLEAKSKQEITTYDTDLLLYALDHLPWIKEIESKIREFLSDPSKRQYYFPSRCSHSQNGCLMELATYYNLFAELVDANIGKGTVIYRKKGENICEPATLLSKASESYDPNLHDEESESINVKNHTRMNGLYFSDLQLGMDFEALKTIISSLISTDIAIEPCIFLKEEKDCAITFNAKDSSSLGKTLSKLLTELSSKLIDQNLVGAIQMINVTDKQITFKKSRNLVLLVDKLEISSNNPFDLLKEKL
jgi:transcriptional repressor NF-X1